MTRTICPSIFVIVLAAPAAAQPQIAANGVLNAASNAFVGLPNSSIAQGSIFSIYGTNLGPASSPRLAYPLQTTLGGVSVQITSGNTVVNAIPIFVGQQQVNAILPGSTPTGSATATVTYNGQTSNAGSFQVIASSFGIFTVSSTGFGAGIITNTHSQLYSVNSSARPGDTATIWGTGLGASTGDDGSAPPQQIDMPNLPLSVYVGTQQAIVTYRGRGGFTGEDQINFVVPAGITSCYAPVAVEIGNIVSNFATMPIAPAEQSCPDPAMPVSSMHISTILLARSTGFPLTDSTVDFGEAYFGTPIPFALSDPYAYKLPLLPQGTCGGDVTFTNVFDVLGPQLDAGPVITITGPNGSKQLTPSGGIFYDAELGGGSGATAQPLYLDPGAYTVSASGGTQVEPLANVGPFSQTFTMPALVWTNESSITTLDRSAGLDVTWAGGDPDGTVQITGIGSGTGFACNANTGDQHFTVPAFVLLSLPPSSAAALILSTTSTTAFAASGISSGTIYSTVTIVKNVIYH